MHEYSKRIGEHIKSCYSDFNKMTREELEELKAWACVMKDLTEYDINKRGIEAMDEAEQEEKMYGRMGYRGRAANGRFVHRSGRGRSAGYIPYIHMMDDEDYFAYDDIPYPMMNYRMGYTGDRGRSMTESGERSGSYGREMHQPSRYGETYGRYKDSRKHYTESSDPESKKRMDESTQEYVEEFAENLREMYKTADAPVKQKLKADLTKMIQQLQ